MKRQINTDSYTGRQTGRKADRQRQRSEKGKEVERERDKYCGREGVTAPLVVQFVLNIFYQTRQKRSAQKEHEVHRKKHDRKNTTYTRFLYDLKSIFPHLAWRVSFENL